MVHSDKKKTKKHTTVQSFLGFIILDLLQSVHPFSAYKQCGPMPGLDMPPGRRKKLLSVVYNKLHYLKKRHIINYVTRLPFMLLTMLAL